MFPSSIESKPHPNIRACPICNDPVANPSEDCEVIEISSDEEEENEISTKKQGGPEPPDGEDGIDWDALEVEGKEEEEEEEEDD